MSVTLTSNYRETLAPETLALIDKLRDENYGVEDMLVFIDENSEEDFQGHYETYVQLGEEYGYEAIDAFLNLADDPSDLRYFDGAFLGRYFNARDMAEDYFDGETDRLDYRIVIDWSETAEYLLQHDVDRVDDFFFRHECY